jgi:hypothetical protein
MRKECSTLTLEARKLVQNRNFQDRSPPLAQRRGESLMAAIRFSFSSKNCADGPRPLDSLIHDLHMSRGKPLPPERTDKHSESRYVVDNDLHEGFITRPRFRCRPNSMALLFADQNFPSLRHIGNSARARGENLTGPVRAPSRLSWAAQRRSALGQKYPSAHNSGSQFQTKPFIKMGGWIVHTQSPLLLMQERRSGLRDAPAVLAASSTLRPQPIPPCWGRVVSAVGTSRPFPVWPPVVVSIEPPP